VKHPQPGIFALGTTSHAYLEFDASNGSAGPELVMASFIDGTENPTLIDAPELAVIGKSTPGAGGTVLLLQKWAHDSGAFEAVAEADRELVMGPRKLDSVELDDKASDAHVASTDQAASGKVFSNTATVQPSARNSSPRSGERTSVSWNTARTSSGSLSSSLP
jgi:deferrochelatase/peroxidase EfeB